MKTVITKRNIRKIIRSIGKQVTRDYSKIVSNENPLVVIGVLNGCFVFMADLIRELKIPIRTEFIIVKSYKDNLPSKDINVILDLKYDIKDKHILIVEDIIDSGKTFQKILELLESRSPSSIKICTLLDKEFNREVPIKIDYCGKKLKKTKFVFGYGMDDNEIKRNLSGIYTI